MLNWYQEDYAEFVKECKQNLESMKTNKANDIINGITPPKWADAMIKLAENQLIFAEYMAMEAGLDD